MMNRNHIIGAMYAMSIIGIIGGLATNSVLATVLGIFLLFASLMIDN